MNEPNPISYLMALALIVAVGAFLWSNRPRRKEPQKPIETVTLATPKPTPAPDPFLSEVENARKDADAKVSAATRQVKESLDARFGEDVKLKERLAAFAKQQGLDEALTALWEKVRNFPSWMERPDFAQYNTLNLQNLAGESKGIDYSRVEFDYAGQRFKVEGHRRMGYDSSFVDLSFFEDGAEVFALSAGEHDPDYGKQYQVFDIRAFKKSGNWAKVLLDLHAQLRMQQEKFSAEMGYFRAEEIKERFAE